ncbi:MAG: hypothetical protein IKU29_12145 [Parabacteroides sp.]|nr:hypothetical protein [Parabacteroides sp.]
MNQKTLNELAEAGYITDVTLVAACNEDPSLLEIINFDDFVTQVVSPTDTEEDSDIEIVKTAEELLNEAIKEGGQITLDHSLNLTMPLIIDNEVEIDLNGKTLMSGVFAENGGEYSEGNSDAHVFRTVEGADLTIIGTGKVMAQEATYCMAVWANGGKVTIKGGTYSNASHGDLIYASYGGKVEIYGGIFKPAEKKSYDEGTQDHFPALNVKDGDRAISSITVFGGRFYGFNPGNCMAEGKETNFVAEGFESVEVESGVFEVRKSEESPIEIESATE